ncbi:MAG: hypothetical protein CML97_07105 [Rhodobiaceae bacterium]|nr:hypothetical protein [Rhodobiaceae bacterium]|tara:strand:- start:919 stop:1425 length:507 start_codon:yes stop_codon:yes gene_type:complete
MASPQKVKGKSYENAKAKFLTEIFDQKFIRVPTSGAFLGGKNYERRLEMTEGQVMAFKGDIIPPDDWKYFNCECKFYKDFKFHQLLNESKVLDSWIDETLSTANENDLNLIFMKFNNIGEYVAYESKEKFRAKQYLKYYRYWRFTSHEQFWNEYNIEKIRRRCKGEIV